MGLVLIGLWLVGGSTEATFLLSDPASPVYYAFLAAAGSEDGSDSGTDSDGDSDDRGKILVDQSSQLGGNIHANGDIHLKKGSSVAGDASAVDRIKGKGRVIGQAVEGALALDLPTLLDEATARALADRIFEGSTTFDEDQVVDDIVFVDGTARFRGALDGGGTVIASEDLRLDKIAGRGAGDGDGADDGGPPPGLDPATRLSLIAFRDIKLERGRAMRGVLYAGRKVELKKESLVEGVLLAGREIKVGKESVLAFVEFDESPPEVSDLTPADGAVVPTATPTISAAFADDLSGVDAASVVLRLDGVDRTAEAQITAAGLNFTPAGPLAEGGHGVELSVSDVSGKSANVTWSFVVDTVPPALAITAPSAAVIYDDTTPIEVAYSDAVAGIDLGSLAILLDGVDLTAGCTVGPASASCVSPALAAGAHTVEAAVSDLAGNAASASVGFEVDLTPELSASKVDDLLADNDGDGMASPGDVLRYTIDVVNSGVGAATGVELNDLIPAHTAVVPGSVAATQGTVLSEDPVVVALGDIGAGTTATVSFDVAVDDPVPAGVMDVVNQGTVTSIELPAVLTDDPALGGASDPTVTSIRVAPHLVAEKTDVLATDADGDGVPSPGDTLEYTVTLINTGNTSATGVVFTDAIPTHTTVVAGSVVSSQGTVDSEDPVQVTVGEIAGGDATATITFRVAIDVPVPAGVTDIVNQGAATSAELPVVLTDDPDLGGADDPTVTMIAAEPALLVEKTDTLFADAEGDGVASPGDELLYTISVANVGSTSATAVVLTDPIPANTAVVPGSVQTSQGSVVNEDPVEVALGEIAGGGEATVTFRVLIAAPFPSGATEIANQANVASGELPDVPSDDPDLPGAADPTVTGVFVTPEIALGDASALEADAASGGLSFVLTLSEPSNREVGVDYATADGTALAGVDYQAATGRVILAPGETVAEIHVFGLDDLLYEPDETFRVLLSNPIEAVITDSEGVGTILDDDPDGTPPTAEIVSPADNATLTVPVEIIGIADDANFLEYVLDVSPAGKNVFTTLATDTMPVINGVLGRIDPTLLRNALYDVRLRVYDLAGLVTTTVVNYQVDGNLKLGSFSLAFTDLEVPLSGLPITVSRTYDSRDKRRGDFGVGWRLGIQTLDLGVNGTQGENWRVDRVGDIIPTYFLVPTREHKVAITLPDGQVEEFDFTPQPSSSVLLPFQFLSPAYTARPGTLGSLSVSFADLLVNGAQPGPVELLDLDTFDLYDPQSFVYTAADGTEFRIDKSRGVERVTDRNGNTLTIGAGGIFHSAGVGVTFARDSLGRITSMTDPNGNVQTYAYDVNGDLVAHDDAEGQRTTFQYDSTHNVLEILDPRGLSPTRYEYDAEGRLLATVDPNGNRVGYSIDVAGRQLVITDRRGNPTVYAYDDDGNVLAETDALGGITDYTYDSRGNELTVTDPRGNTFIRTYDARDNLLTETDPLGNTVTRTYNAHDQLLTETDAASGVTAYAYDARGNRISVTDALGNMTSHTYDANGNRLQTTDASGRTLAHEYDARGNLVRTIFPDGAEETRTYDANGNVVTATDANGNLTARVYDGSNRLIEEIDPLGSSSTTEYTANGREAARVDENGNRTAFEYDARGDLVRTTLADGTQETRAYDANGNLVTETDANGNPTSYAYDALDRLIAVTDALGQVTTYGYDAAGNRISQTDARGHVTTFEYDAVGRQIARTLPDGSRETRSYSGNGTLASRSDFQGRTTSYAYDLNRRLVQRTHPDGTDVDWSYTPAGRVASFTDTRGTTSFAYDARDRVTSMTYPDGRRLDYAYDPAGNRTELTATIGATTLTTSYSYDGLNRLVSVTDSSGGTYAHGYDAAGNRTSLSYPNGVTTSSSFDSVNRLSSLATAAGASTTQSYSFTLDATGRRTRVDEADGTARVYSYDAIYRVIRDRVTDGAAGLVYQRDFVYDAVGNRLSLSEDTGSGPVVTNYTYDSRDRLLTENAVAYSHDPNGNLLAEAGVASYEWDTENRLTEVTVADGTQVVTVYDPQGNRVRTETTPPGGPTSVIDYLVDVTPALSQVIAESDGFGNVLAFYDRGDELLSLLRPAASDRRYYHADGLGSVRLLTDAAATVTDSYAYTAFGVLLDHTGTDPQPYRYTGAPFDPTLGFYYLGARYLAPATGRFASMDPVTGDVFDPPSLHAYLYARSDPVNNIDPSGLYPISIATALPLRSIRLTLPSFVP